MMNIKFSNQYNELYRFLPFYLSFFVQSIYPACNLIHLPQTVIFLKLYFFPLVSSNIYIKCPFSFQVKLIFNRYGHSMETPSTIHYSSNIFLTFENQKNIFHKRVFFLEAFTVTDFLIMEFHAYQKRVILCKNVGHFRLFQSRPFWASTVGGRGEGDREGKNRRERGQIG
jgi:hypothetical protein